MLHFCVCPKPACCSCICRGLKACLHILPSILNFLWHELFTNLSLWFAPLFFLQPTLLLLSTILHFLLHYSAIPAVMLFDPSLLDLFRSTAYSSLNDLVWSLGVLLHGLRAPASHLFPPGRPWAIYFPWASSALSNSASPWAFTNSFGLPWLNYFIFHLWDSWAHHQLLTFFACITSGLL